MPGPTSAISRARTLAAPAVVAAAVTGLLAPVSAAAATVQPSGSPSVAVASTRPTGIDVSRYQSGSTLTSCEGAVQVGWAAVRGSGRSFAFVKASGSRPSGTVLQDPCLARNWAGARASGLYRGAYHYAVPSARAGSAAADARFFVAVTGSLQNPGDLPPVLDLEATGGLGRAQVQAWATTWLSTVRALTGRQPVLYTGPGFWTGSVAGGSAFARFPLWIAHYTRTSPRIPAPWSRWTFWQSSSQGRVPGVSGDVDLDTFNGTADELRALAHPATEPTATASGDVVYGGQTWSLSGALRTAAGDPLPGATVRLFRRVAGSGTWTAVASTVTAARTGAYRFDQQPDRAASYQVRYAGGLDFAASASTVRSHAYSDRVPTALTAVVSRAAVVKRQPVRLAGALTAGPARAAVRGAQVTVYRKVGAGPWTRVRTLTTAGSGAGYATSLRPVRTAVYQVVCGGSTSRRPAVAPLRTIAVR